MVEGNIELFLFRTKRKYVFILEYRLTHENIDICELSLQQLDEKVEKVIKYSVLLFNLEFQIRFKSF